MDNLVNQFQDLKAQSIFLPQKSNHLLKLQQRKNVTEVDASKNLRYLPEKGSLVKEDEIKTRR